MEDLERIKNLCDDLKKLMPITNGEAHLAINKILSLIDTIRSENQTTSSKLTKRELEILEIACKGFTTREIASALSISDKTVEFHFKNIYLKLEVSGRAEAIAFVISQRYLG